MKPVENFCRMCNTELTANGCPNPSCPDRTDFDDRHAFSSGAMSSGQKPRYDLIPARPMVRIARRFGEGAAKYGENNWRKGLADREFLLDRLNHAQEHLLKLMADVSQEGDVRSTAADDDAAAIILNIMFIMEAQGND